MHDSYRDLMEMAEALGKEPLWWDVNGVPRFREPHVPRHLMGKIRCQYCRREFLVSLTDNIYHMRGWHQDADGRPLPFTIGDPNVTEDPEGRELVYAPSDTPGIVRVQDPALHRECRHLALIPDWHYGDPPAHGGCVGETMSSIPEWEWKQWDQETETSTWD